MNSAFVVLGVLMAAGAPLIHQEFRQRRLAIVGFGGMAIAGVGTVLVGFFPENVNHTLHVLGAAGPFIVGNVALIILSCTLTMPMGVRVLTGIAGGIGLVGLFLFALGVDLGLGQGAVERVAAYPQTIWLIIFGLYMSRNHYVRRRRIRRDCAGGIGGRTVTNVTGGLGWPTLTDSTGAPYARWTRVADSKEEPMAMFDHEIRTRQGSCPAHGQVNAEKRVAKLKFPFFVTGAARAAAALRPFRCPSCGAKVS